MRDINKGCRTSAVLLIAIWVAWVGSERVSRAQQVWQDPSPHERRFVEVDDGVRLELLDWGGSGRSVVLLPGSGNTAHIFDDFAPKLRECCHVYGISRRGYGASSRPDSGYDDQRLAEDVLRVLDSEKVAGPVLVGHSMAGGELTTLGNQHSDRLAGLVYLDALGDPRDFPANDPAYQSLFANLPVAMREPPPSDRRSLVGYQKSQADSGRGAFPESELRQLFAVNPDGSLGRYQASTDAINTAIGRGQVKRTYTRIRVPVLAFFEYPKPDTNILQPHGYRPERADERAAVGAYNRATAQYVDRWLGSVKASIPAATLIDLPGAGHYVFLTREAEVQKALREFLRGLGPQ